MLPYIQDGSSTIVPIITVYEGTKSLFKGRSQCKNAYHICLYGKAPEDLWEQCGSSCKSCAFGQIKQPTMGWSREGLRCMVELRAFKANGGVVGVEHIKTKGNANSLIKKAMKQAQKVFHGINPENIGNIYILNKGKVTSLYRTLG